MNQYVGLSGALVIRELVKQTKPMWENKSYKGLLTILCAIFYGIVFNVSLAVALGNNVKTSVAIGVVTGVLSSVWNQIIEK